MGGRTLSDFPPCESKWCEPRPCKLCGAPIVFATTTSGKKIPLDPQASRERGNVAVDLSTGRAHVFGKADAGWARTAGATLHLAHFATCPNYRTPAL